MALCGTTGIEIYSFRTPHGMFQRLCTCMDICLWSMCADTILCTVRLFAQHCAVTYRFTVMWFLHIENFGFPRLSEERTNFEIDTPSAPPPEGAGMSNALRESL